MFIISKKIEPKNIEDDNIADLRIIYYSYLVIYYRHENIHSETAHAYSKILESLHKVLFVFILKHKIQVNVGFGFNTEYNNVLENYSMYLIISEYSEDKVMKSTDLVIKIENLSGTIQIPN